MKCPGGEDGVVQDILLEVNVGGEESKSGIARRMFSAEAELGGGGAARGGLGSDGHSAGSPGNRVQIVRFLPG